MHRKICAELLAAAIFLASQSIISQMVPASPKVVAKPQLATRMIDLTHVDKLLGLPASIVTGYPQHCSSDGYIFSEIYAVSDKPGVLELPEIYSISEQRDVKRIRLKLPTEYKQLSLRSLYAARDRVILLVQAAQPVSLEPQTGKPRRTFFLSIADRDGEGQKLVQLDLAFEPIKAAIFDSGELIVLGADTTNLQPVLSLLHEDGTVQRILDFDPRTYMPSQDTNRTNVPRADETHTFALQRLILSSLTKVQLVPWGSDILLVQPGSKLPIYRFNKSGQHEPVSIKLPEGFLLETILGSSEEDTWVIVTKDANSSQEPANGGVAGGVVENPAESLFEVNPHTGEVIDRLLVRGPHPGEISCAAHGKLMATYYGSQPQEDAPDELTYASAPR